MNSENTQRLLHDFPGLYRRQYIDPDREGMQTNIAGWGFECGDGWMTLLYRLSQAITEHSQRTGLNIVASQVKEKFGTLRFYTDGADDLVWNLIDEAERASAGICEVCGAPGMLTTQGWCMTRCELHRRH